MNKKISLLNERKCSDDAYTGIQVIMLSAGFTLVIALVFTWIDSAVKSKGAREWVQVANLSNLFDIRFEH